MEINPWNTERIKRERMSARKQNRQDRHTLNEIPVTLDSSYTQGEVFFLHSELLFSFWKHPSADPLMHLISTFENWGFPGDRLRERKSTLTLVRASSQKTY